MGASPGEKLYTVEDIYALPEGERAELIDGQLYRMELPETRHQMILSDIYLIIGNYIASRGKKCRAFVPSFGVFPNSDDKTYVEPDITVICDSSKFCRRGCMGAPDWVVEIVSPGSRKMDCVIKRYKYRSAGVREYWIVDPEKNHVTAYDFESDHVRECTFSDSLSSSIFPDLSVDFSVFLNLPEYD